MCRLVQRNLLRANLGLKMSEAIQRMSRRVQGNLYGILSQLLTTCHNSKSIFEWSVSRCHSYKMKRRWNQQKSSTRWELDHAHNPFLTICRTIIWSSVKKQVALSTRWATWSWSNWDKPRWQFSVHLACQRDWTCVYAVFGFDPIQVRWTGSEQPLQRWNSLLPYHSNPVKRDKERTQPMADGSSKSRGYTKMGNDTTRTHLCNGPMEERRTFPSFSNGARLDWDVGQVPRLHLQDWHQSWSTSPTATTIWKHTPQERCWFQ